MWIDGREWKLVPVEPTPEMLEAGAKQVDWYAHNALECYHAMLAAAPTPPAQAAPSDEHVSVVGMPEFDALLDHIYEHGTTSEGVLIRADAFARALLSRYGQAPAASPDFPHYEMAFICRVLEGDHPEKADLDTALGMARSVRVALLKERAAQAPAASVEPVAWLVDWPDEPELGHYLTESPGDIDSGRRRALVFRDAAPVAASAEPRSIGYIDYKGNHGHARAVLTRGMDEQGNDWADGTKIYAAPVAAQAPHPDDVAVDRFAAAMKAKLAKKRAEGRAGWDNKEDCSQDRLSLMLRAHVAKGDPVDVGNFAMMLHQRGERISGRDEALPAADGDALDASRYRWLRGHFRFAADSDSEIWFDSGLEHSPAEQLDAAIDAAMQRAIRGEE
ncbi:hypothetical protein [Pigmentiphaga daeguensis]|uniref:Uncharacterized protein n=1 Tax=Pigmentiphaga daeguensis TaxID=414049 RepID=A0ABP3MYS5_9BURK